MKVLLTGATGFIGSRLREQLAARGHEVIATRRTAAPTGPAAAGCRWLRMDLADPSMALPPLDADAVIYLAQSAHYRDFPRHAPEVLAVNAAAVLRLLDWARGAGVRSFVYASSANVYGSSALPLTESIPPSPDSFYGRTKLAGEMMVRSYGEYFRCTVFRLFTVYGAGQEGMLIPSLTARVRAGEPIQIRGSQGLRLSPIVVDDVARFLRVAAESSGPAGAEVLNLGGPESLTLREIGQHIGAAVGRLPRFEELGGPEPGGWVSDQTALGARFGMTPDVRFQDGIVRAVGAA